MGNKALIYKQKAYNNLKESKIHLKRLEEAFDELKKDYTIPLDKKSFNQLINDKQNLAFSDQIIYRFSKLQDCMGAKLFKSILLYQGENVDKPFLDILNQLEKIDIISVDEWFELRDLRNMIAHDYEDNEETVINILNTIYSIKSDLKQILNSTERLLDNSSAPITN